MDGVFQFWLQCAGVAAVIAVVVTALSRWLRLAVAAAVVVGVFVAATARSYLAGSGAFIVGAYAAAFALVPVLLGVFLGGLLRKRT